VVDSTIGFSWGKPQIYFDLVLLDVAIFRLIGYTCNKVGVKCYCS
jgi:hypothetical protein